MYINKISGYVPHDRIPNDYFKNLNDLSDEWIIERTGIKERRKASVGENTHTMGIEALKVGLESLPYPKEEIDLIVGATYTPYDTIFTLAHACQHFLDISDIPVVSVNTACSSFLNAVEVVEGYFATGKAKRALIVLSEHNTAYSDEHDKKSGHLWGDGAAAIFMSNERVSNVDLAIKSVSTGGAGNIGKAPESVYLRPANEGFKMPFGKDVFLNACQYMAKSTKEILEKSGYSLEDLTYLIPHQANLRITKNVAKNLNLPEEKALSNIQYLGNTGCAGAAIVIEENQHKFKKGDLVVVTVFGGGYSYGAMLIEC
ncbi:ketoacyl-ACP synthase III [Fulvivirgaceae bacterium BMA10]|uniref:Ketoacyl-ACP synthase III n=1 Tax=Splendidivirga corallicola TaxID=3051826 RepID=A0ABT8KM82_9BACT|nr:ketoacyl-ACP synthase III [Fulvivirgaceae bacterium BMA10]